VAQGRVNARTGAPKATDTDTNTNADTPPPAPTASGVDDEAKRAYVDMVMRKDRFQGLVQNQRKIAALDEASADANADITGQPGAAAVEPEEAIVPIDLGSKLEAAAVEEEKMARSRREARSKQAAENLRVSNEEREKLALRQFAAEKAAVEMAGVEARRREMERDKRLKDEAAIVEEKEKRRREAESKMDEYWSRTLEEEERTRRTKAAGESLRTPATTGTCKGASESSIWNDERNARAMRACRSKRASQNAPLGTRYLLLKTNTGGSKTHYSLARHAAAQMRHSLARSR